MTHNAVTNHDNGNNDQKRDNDKTKNPIKVIPRKNNYFKNCVRSVCNFSNSINLNVLRWPRNVEISVILSCLLDT